MYLLVFPGIALAKLYALHAQITSVVQSHANCAGCSQLYPDWILATVASLAFGIICLTMTGKYSGRPVSCDVPIPSFAILPNISLSTSGCTLPCCRRAIGASGMYFPSGTGPNPWIGPSTPPPAVESTLLMRMSLTLTRTSSGIERRHFKDVQLAVS
jgi:hypothetical protein